MLELRANCECCDRDLPPDSTEAMICSYECTFCRECVENILSNVCPNCGGGFCIRPIRPKTARREGVSLAYHPESRRRVNTKYSVDELREFSAQLKHLHPNER